MPARAPPHPHEHQKGPGLAIVAGSIRCLRGQKQL